ncbi:MAG: hypothetical protein HFH32_09015 [Eubacterium sp.]|jgi:uncharacterized protein YukE|nr:hypothetical protein [Eubacterium sp.]
MAKIMHTIEMEFQNARRQADELEQISKSLSMLADSSFQSCLAGIAAAWKGENAAAFCKKGNLVGNNVKNTAQDLKHVAETIREIAQNTYNAEKQNYEIAQARTYLS